MDQEKVIMRMLLITWKNKRHTWQRRARWYADSPNNIGKDIRLNFEDESGKMNHYPTNESQAQAMWDDFKASKINAFGVRI